VSRLSYKTLFIILLFLLIPIVFLIRINQKSKKISAAWWDDMWHYRQAINISSHSSTESNVYISTTINLGSSTKAQADDGDFRFTNQAGNLLPYYISAGTGTTSITFHINFDSFPAGAQTIYAYYGNPSANNGFSVSDFSTAATNYTIGSLGGEEIGGAPVAYWKFDEGVGTTLYNSNSNQNNGYFNSPSPLWADETQCINGKCLSFDGTQSAFSNYDLSWNNTNSISLSFWVKPQNTTDSQRGILGKQYSLYEWSIYQSGSSVSLVYWNTAGGHTNGMDDTWGNVLTANKWTHLVYTWDGSTSRFYANGRLVKTKTATNPSINMDRTNNMMFGGNIYTWGNTYFRGLIDEVKIFNYLRSVDQIKQDYANHGSSVNIGGTSIQTSPGNLVVYYKFDEGAGTTVHNSGTGSTALNASNVNVTLTNEGKIKSALNFTGASVYYVQSNNSLLLNSGQTYSVWVSHSSSGWLEGILTTHNYVTTSNLGINTSNDHFSISIGYTDGSREYNTKESNYVITPNKWTHVVLKYDNVENSVSFYINGTFDSKWILNKTVKFTADKVLLGQWSNEYINNSYKFSGLIDEAKIYDYALSEDEIKREFNQSSSVIFSIDKLDVGSTSASALYCIPGSTDPCSPPIAQWNFEESVGTSAFDSSSSGNNGVFIGATLPTRSIGKIGTALSFNGLNNYVLLPTSGGSDTKGNLGFADTDNFTLSLWYKGTDTGTGDGSLGKTLIGRNSNDIYANFVINGGYVEYIHYNGGWQHNLKSTTQVSDNKWHYISYVNYSNETGDLYIDGIKQISGLSSSIDSATRYFKADNLMSGYNNKYTSGQLDDVRIYNYARTPAQIAWDYNQGAPIGWWKFDECQGSIAHDSSGIGNTGAIVIGASGTQTSVGTCTTSGTAWGVGATGKINSSLGFDGTDDYIQIPNIISGDNTHTILFWAKPTSYNKVWIDMSGDSGYSFVQISPTNLYVGYSPTTPSYRTYAYTFNLNNWYHIAISKNNTGNNVNVYVNGNLLNVYTGSVGDMNSGSIIYLGKFHNNGYNIGGQLDDARIYNYALTTEQIKQIYNGGAINFN